MGLLLKQLILLSFFWSQFQAAIDKRSTEIKKLEKRINEIVDRIYRDFSISVGVGNIREYEENQLKFAQEHAEERLSLNSQLSKLKYQYARSLTHLPSIDFFVVGIWVFYFIFNNIDR